MLRTVKQAFELDSLDGNSLRTDAIKREIQALTDVDFFEFKDRDFKWDKSFQLPTLLIIFDAKQDLRRKARLVAGGH